MVHARQTVADELLRDMREAVPVALRDLLRGIRQAPADPVEDIVAILRDARSVRRGDIAPRLRPPFHSRWNADQIEPIQGARPPPSGVGPAGPRPLVSNALTRRS